MIPIGCTIKTSVWQHDSTLFASGKPGAVPFSNIFTVIHMPALSSSFVDTADRW